MGIKYQWLKRLGIRICKREAQTLGTRTYDSRQETGLLSDLLVRGAGDGRVGVGVGVGVTGI